MASCATRVSAACASRGHVRALTFRRGRPPRVECPARRSRRGGLAATAPGPDAAADADEAAAALVAWATADGLRLSPSRGGRALSRRAEGAGRHARHRARRDRADPPRVVHGVRRRGCARGRNAGPRRGHRGRRTAPASTRGADVSEETALALFVAFARRHPSRTPFGTYVDALPAALPSSPLFLDDAAFRRVMPAMPLSLVDAADDARADLFLAWDVAAAVVDAVPGEAALEFEEFQWAWASVRSMPSRSASHRGRGAGSGDGSGDESGNAAETRSLERRSLEKDRANEADASRKVASRRCLVPVVDMMNHACARRSRGPRRPRRRSRARR